MGRRAILIVCAAFPCILSSESLPIRTYTAADGLPSNHVDCIVADSRGFLWFCTPEGLSRFDGYHFINYTVDEGLAHNLVTTLIETRSGDYYAGTARGVSRFNPEGRGPRFTTYLPGDQNGDNFIVALRQSRSGQIWCATRKALYRWDGVNPFCREDLPFTADQIGDAVEDARGDLWVATSSGIFVARDHRIVRSPGQNDGIPADMGNLWLDPAGRLWATVPKGVVLVEPRPAGGWDLKYTGRWDRTGHFPTALGESRDGNLWVGTDWGISRIDVNRPSRAVKNIGREQGLSDRQINALATDRAGNIWAGTEGAGVMRIDGFGFTTYREQDGLPTDRVWSVFENRAGELMALTVTGRAMRSVSIFDGTRFNVVDLPVFDGHATWVPDRILLQSRTREW